MATKKTPANKAAPAENEAAAPQAPGTVVRLQTWPKSVKPEDQDAGQLGKLTKAELIERAEAAGLDTSGTKAEVIDRLETPAEAQPDEVPPTVVEPEVVPQLSAHDARAARAAEAALAAAESEEA